MHLPINMNTPSVQAQTALKHAKPISVDVDSVELSVSDYGIRINNMLSRLLLLIDNSVFLKLEGVISSGKILIAMRC